MDLAAILRLREIRAPIDKIRDHMARMARSQNMPNVVYMRKTVAAHMVRMADLDTRRFSAKGTSVERDMVGITAGL